MEFTLRIPDQVWKEDPNYVHYIKALQLMLDRMATSHYKYGNIDVAYPECAHGIDSARERMYLYDGVVSLDIKSKTKTGDGNTEHCLDAANFLIIEFIRPSHPRAHFRPQTSTESPGIKFKEE